MTSRSDGASIDVNRTLLGGGVILIFVGALLGMIGGLAATVAVIGAARSWVRHLDEPPSATARRRLAQAKAAAIAGTEGWRQANGQALGAPSSRQPARVETTG
jgi:hypothetical protein